MKADRRIVLLDQSIAKHNYRKDSLLEILHTAQEIYGYLDREILLHIANALKIPPSHVLGVATFYNFFKLKKPGAHVVTFCYGTACFVRGVEEIVAAVEREFNVKRGETSPDGRLSVFITRCIGACAMAPNVIIDDEHIGKATKDLTINKIRQRLEAWK
ncbi:MAG: NAD(P)H-dependent oxidoreductase subunit E [Nitrososphaerota archaeon]|nr:NAD(P)H-dependent oxidoreductase subunit E [Candidatus Bathyarchaeota archaeon]MDW8048064.1 NAD(P)H-dependent oxidoreductase subunit E [Nitrososphaerota archaeon]